MVTRFRLLLIAAFIVVAAACAPPLIAPPPPSSPLTAANVYAQVAPALAYIETEGGTGSGAVLIDGYIVTNAHVVWPDRQVRVVFPDGTEIVDAPVRAWDMLADLAIIGPLDIDMAPLTVSDGESLPAGSEVFLLGYPGESEAFPQPAITRGIISRLRQWQNADLTYFQSDAMIVGGQSGGVMVDGRGQVIGISGLEFAGEMALAASVADLQSRIAGLLAGEDVNGIGNRMPGEGSREIETTLENLWATRAFLIEAESGATVEIEAHSENDIALTVMDYNEDIWAEADDTEIGSEVLTVTLDGSPPHILVVEQYDESPAQVLLKADADLVAVPDLEDGAALSFDELRSGNLDFPGDTDTFTLALASADRIEIIVDSVQIDAFINVFARDDPDTTSASDDDSAGGIYGSDARLIYLAPSDGEYIISVSAAMFAEVGGYFLRLSPAPPDAKPAPYDEPYEEPEELEQVEVEIG